MRSHPNLDHHELATEALELHPDDWSHGHAIAHLTTEHPQARSWPDDNPELAHELDHRAWIYDYAHPTQEPDAEQAFDRLNPEFGVPADGSDRIGHHDVQQREATLALGIRVAVHDSRQNDSNAVVWQAGQDYRAADALQAARIRRGSERTGPER
jgi:hypothetical protein